MKTIIKTCKNVNKKIVKVEIKETGKIESIENVIKDMIDNKEKYIVPGGQEVIYFIKTHMDGTHDNNLENLQPIAKC